MNTLTAALMCAVFVFSLVAPELSAFAQEGGTVKKLRNRAEFSVVDTSGNTDLFTLSLKNTLEYKFRPDLMGTWNLSALYGEQDSDKNAERYSTDLRFDYDLATTYYSYLLGGWLRDRFAGFDHRYHIGPGLGRKFLIGPRHFLKAETGVNWTREDYIEEGAEDFLEGRIYGQYDFVVSEGNKFFQGLEYLLDFEDSDNYKIISVTGVTSTLTRGLAIKVAYEIRYQNRPVPETVEKTDTTLSASLVLSY
ncbi:DUF481 domain-containing protein [Desulfosarcina widdelii]|nr:DUF481 domain-containing protein [Desulfosarcina widdelii]